VRQLINDRIAQFCLSQSPVVRTRRTCFRNHPIASHATTWRRRSKEKKVSKLSAFVEPYRDSTVCYPTLSSAVFSHQTRPVTIQRRCHSHSNKSAGRFVTTALNWTPEPRESQAINSNPAWAFPHAFLAMYCDFPTGAVGGMLLGQTVLDILVSTFVISSLDT
jgi:hypothetical protein